MRPCVTCGVEDELGEMYSSGEGLVCPACFSVDEGAIDPGALSTREAVLLPARYLPMLVAPLSTFAVAGDVGVLYLLGGAVWLFWMGMVGVMGFGAPFFLGHLAEQLRQDLRRPGTDTWERAALVAGHVWHAVGYFGALAGSLAVAQWAFAVTGI